MIQDFVPYVQIFRSEHFNGVGTGLYQMIVPARVTIE